MSDSTSIEALPGPNGGNIKLGVTEKPVQQATIAPPSTVAPVNMMEKQSMPLAPAQMDPNSLNKVINGLQSAQAHGMTALPSRDIPMNTVQHVQDRQVKPNYIPESDKKNYIEEEDTYNSMLEKRKNKQEQQDRLDVIYDEFQVPILIMILFFVFQLPFVQKKLISFFPTLFLKDGHMSMGGYLVKTALFGLTFYVIMKLTNYASEL